jgi:thymidylate synthase ThyX
MGQVKGDFMGQLIKPKVYLVGYTTTDAIGMRDYLRESGNEDFHGVMDKAFSQGVQWGEILCSFYAKMCYASLTLGHNKNVAATRDIPSNIKACFNQGHGSVFEHCTLNFVVRNCSRVLTHELVRHRAGTAFCLAGDTEIWSGARIHGRWNGSRKKWTIKDLFGYTRTSHGRSRLKLVTVRCFDGAEFVPSRIRGVMESGVKPVFKVTLSDGKTIRCSWDHRFFSRSNGNEGWFSLRHLRAGDSIATNGRRIARPTKEQLQGEYLDEGLTQPEIADSHQVSEALVKKWLTNYGIKKPGGGHFASGSTPWNKGIKGVVTFSMSDEAKANISRAKKGSNNPHWKGGLSIKKRKARGLRKSACEECGATEDLHGHHIDRDHWNATEGNIQTLCNSCHQKLHRHEDSNPNALVIRWREIVSIEPDGTEMTYDLEVDHPAHNFVANGFVTHNSQTSGRYVRTDQIDFVFDPILIPVKDEIEELLSIIEERYQIMEEKLGLDSMKDFDVKKKFTSALRRILPNGQSNEIGFSVNIRALRHIVQLRTSRHAEWEIREVFSQVYNLAKAKFPLLFYGAKEEEVDGLVEVSGMKLQPYEKIE